jgi:hypothetical protein
MNTVLGVEDFDPDAVGAAGEAAFGSVFVDLVTDGGLPVDSQRLLM